MMLSASRMMKLWYAPPKRRTQSAMLPAFLPMFSALDAVIDLYAALQTPAQEAHGAQLASLDVSGAAVAEDKNAELLRGAERDQLLGNGFDGGGDPRRILLVNRKQQRGLRAWRVPPPKSARRRSADRENIDEPEHGAAGAQGNPGKAERAKHQKDALQHRELDDRQDLVEDNDERGGGGAREQQQGGARPRHAVARPGARTARASGDGSASPAGIRRAAGNSHWLAVARWRWLPGRAVHLVHLANQTSETSLSLLLSSSLISMTSASPGVRRKSTRTPFVFGLRRTTGKLTLPAVAESAACGSSGAARRRADEVHGVADRPGLALRSIGKP